MTSSDGPVPEPESAGPDEPQPTAREPQCRITYRTPETLTIGAISILMADTLAVLSFAATTAAVPAEQLPAPEQGTFFDDWIIFQRQSWRGPRRKRSGEDDLATIMPVRRLTYASPLEIILGAPQAYVAAGIGTLWALPA
jgi:hypothetical protein